MPSMISWFHITVVLECVMAGRHHGIIYEIILILIDLVTHTARTVHAGYRFPVRSIGFIISLICFSKVRFFKKSKIIINTSYFYHICKCSTFCDSYHTEIRRSICAFSVVGFNFEQDFLILCFLPHFSRRSMSTNWKRYNNFLPAIQFKN